MKMHRIASVLAVSAIMFSSQIAFADNYDNNSRRQMNNDSLTSESGKLTNDSRHKVNSSRQMDDSQMTQALETLKDNGLIAVEKIRYEKDKNRFEASVLNAQGKSVKVQIDGKSGKLTQSSDKAIHGLTALDVAKKVEAAGYTKIYKIEKGLFTDNYDVEALNANGETIDLTVNFKTGTISE